MALFELFQDGNDLSGLDPGTGMLLFATDGQIEIAAGTLTFDYYGSFVYDANGQLVAGAFSGFEIWDSANGGLQARASGLQIGVSQFFNVALSGDEQAFEAMLFSGNDTLIGSSGDDNLDGHSGSDSIVGGAGDDTLDGGPLPGPYFPPDTLVGGSGNDVYHTYSYDVVVENPGGGTDTVISDWNYVLPANVENLTLVGFERTEGTGNELDNVITGSPGSNLLVGMAGNDTIDGGGGLAGFDTLRGGPGDDVYSDGTDGTMTVEEAPGDGNDTVIAWKDSFLWDNVENLVGMGAGRITLYGNALANVITGNDAGDTLNGSGGNDTLIGGKGDDTFFVDSVADVVRDAGGTDTVWSDVDGFVLPDGIEKMTLGQGGNVAAATGNALDNYILGNTQANFIAGGAGNDTIDGFFGADTIDGGDGIDHFVYHGGMSGVQVVHQGPTVVLIDSIPQDPVITLTNIERIDEGQGSTTHVALDIDGNAGMAYRLYQAAFDRKPDVGGLGYQMHDLDIGVSLEQVASNFIASPEFQRTYGNVDDTQFLTLLYANVLHRPPDDGGLQFHLGEFARGETRAEMLIHFSESPENQANVIGDIQDGMVYVW